MRDADGHMSESRISAQRASLNSKFLSLLLAGDAERAWFCRQSPWLSIRAQKVREVLVSKGRTLVPGFNFLFSLFNIVYVFKAIHNFQSL